MLWLRSKFLSISGPLKGFVTPGLPSSEVGVSDSRATTLANRFPVLGNSPWPWQLWSVLRAEAWFHWVLFPSCTPQPARKLMRVGRW